MTKKFALTSALAFLFLSAAGFALLPRATLAQGTGVQEAEAQETKVHRLAIQVNQNDPELMNTVLSNIGNVKAYYLEKGEDVIIEVVAYGPGVHMLRKDTSPVLKRIDNALRSYEDLSFTVCGNTLDAMAHHEGKMPELHNAATVFPAGLVRLLELQEQGWSYVRP